MPLVCTATRCKVEDRGKERLTVLRQMTPHAHPRPASERPQHAFVILPLSVRPVEHPLRHPPIGLVPLPGISMHKPLEGVDAGAWRDVVDAREADGAIRRRDAWQGRAVRTHAE